MKTLRLPLPIPLAMRPSALSAGLLLLVPVSAQEPQAEPAAPPVEISGEVRLLGKIADGTPALPAPPPVLPQFVVRKAITRHLPDRKVTVRLVDNPGLPPLPMKVEFDAEAFERWSQTPEGMEILGKARERANKNRFVILSGRIYEIAAPYCAGGSPATNRPELSPKVLKRGRTSISSTSEASAHLNTRAFNIRSFSPSVRPGPSLKMPGPKFPPSWVWLRPCFHTQGSRMMPHGSP